MAHSIDSAASRFVPGKVATFLWLAWNFLVTIVRGWLGRTEGEGYTAVVAHYAPDRILPVEEGDRPRLHAFSGCIACGLCDAAVARPAGSERTGPDGPAYLASFVSRSMPGYWTAESYLKRSIDAPRLAQAERVCPMGVPLSDEAQFVKRGLDGLKKASAESGAANAKDS